MTRRWFVDVGKRDGGFAIRVFNVFDGREDDQPIEVLVSRKEDVGEFLRQVGVSTRVEQRYMEVNGLGTLVRIASMPAIPISDLVGRAVSDAMASEKPFVLVTTPETRQEILRRLRQWLPAD